MPYSEDDIADAEGRSEAQADPATPMPRACRSAIRRSTSRDFDGNPQQVTEMDALVAYLQMLGTLVDFSTYEPEQGYR